MIVSDGGASAGFSQVVSPMNAPSSTIEPLPRKVDAETLKAEIVDKLAYSVGKDPIVAKPFDWLAAAILVVRDRAIDRWMESTRAAYPTGAKRVYYFSLEFLIGRLLRDAMSNLDLVEPMEQALVGLGVDLDSIETLEPDAALGNGGLGRLAACFMETMATVEIPAYGYGIRYVHGLFRQEISDGNQVEMPEDWLSHGNLWEFERREAAYEIGFGGMVTAAEAAKKPARPPRQAWKPQEKVMAVAYDTPIVGWRGHRVNTLRLWSAQAIDPIRLDAFNRGDHVGALADRTKAETITRVLYPADSTPAGQELRLRQEYFFVSASLQDLTRRHVQQFGTFANLPEKVAIQLNDTHPAVAVAELMRILVDLNGMEWEKAFALTRATIAYTNHTLLPEALESWPVSLFERLLPRHMQIIYEINAQLLEEANEKLGEDADLSHLSLIDEHNGRRVRMGQLRLRRLAQRQRRVGAAHRADEEDGLPRPQPALPRPHQQQDQRHHAAALADAGEFRPDKTHPRDDRRRLPRQSRPDRRPERARRRQRLPGEIRGGEAGEQAEACRDHPRDAWHHRRSRRALRRAGQAHPRIQAPAPQHHRGGGALRPDPRASGKKLDAAGEDLRRQGGAELLAGEADHQADQRRGAHRQQRSGGAWAAEDRVPAELQRQPRRGDHPGGRPVGADLDGGDWKPRAPAT